jgi:hypothetical protein
MSEHAEHRTALVLMKGVEADATIDSLLDGPGGGDLIVRDDGPFWKIMSQGDIHVSMDAVSSELGAPITLSRWLASMSGFVGQVDTGEDHFTVAVARGDQS